MVGNANVRFSFDKFETDHEKTSFLRTQKSAAW